MNQSLRDQFRCVLSGWTIGRGYESMTVGIDEARAMADAILQHLIDEKYWVVRASQPIGVNGQDNVVWMEDPYIEQEFNGDVVISDRVGLDGDDLHDIAIALMGASVRYAESRI